MDRKIKSVLNFRLNECRCVINEKNKELDLLIHRLLHFDEMHTIYQNQVIKELNSENEGNDFYKHLVLEEVPED